MRQPCFSADADGSERENPLGNSYAAALDIIAAASIISVMFSSVSRRARTIQAPVWLFALGQ